MRHLVLMVLSCIFGMELAIAAMPNVGIEGDIQVVLPRADFVTKPLDDRTPLILRIEEIKANTDGTFTYQLHYIGMEQGTYQLSEFMMQPDGAAINELGTQSVKIDSLLAADHNGELTRYSPSPFPWFGGYRMILISLLALWLLGLVAFAWFGRKKKIAFIQPAVAQLSYSERLRPFVEAAASGKITTQEQAEMERLLTAYWRDRLSLPDQRMSDALAKLKQHDEAGALLRALERWLHRPGGASMDEINQLLSPYHDQPALVKST